MKREFFKVNKDNQIVVTSYKCNESVHFADMPNHLVEPIDNVVQMRAVFREAPNHEAELFASFPYAVFTNPLHMYEANQIEAVSIKISQMLGFENVPIVPVLLKSSSIAFLDVSNAQDRTLSPREFSKYLEVVIKKITHTPNVEHLLLINKGEVKLIVK